MYISILMGSPLEEGNTAALLKPFIDKLKELKVDVEYITLYDKDIKGCHDCRCCQEVYDKPGCLIQDDMQDIYKSILASDCIVFATPIFTWFCTAPMKAVLDRTFCFSKYYGKNPSKSLIEGKYIALVTTCGDEIERGPDLFEEAIRRLFNGHSKLNYIGHLTIRVINGLSDFTTEETIKAAWRFGEKVVNSISPVE